MNIKNMTEKFKSNKLNYATKYSAIIFAIVYVIAIIILVVKRFSLVNILSMSANYVTIVSCVLVLIQLIAFVRDSRQKEFRSRKEYALTLAKQYANDTLGNITYIETVLSIDYNKNNLMELCNLLKDIEISYFTKDSLNEHQQLSKYNKIFLDGNSSINMDLIVSRAIIHQIEGFNDIQFIPTESQKDIANLRFKTLICNTMNNLEYFAMSVNQNVADSDMLFVSIHQTYLKFVRFMYPFICKANVGEELFYTNVIELYRNWNNKKLEIDAIKKKNAEKVKEEIKKTKSVQPL